MVYKEHDFFTVKIWKILVIFFLSIGMAVNNSTSSFIIK